MFPLLLSEAVQWLSSSAFPKERGAKERKRKREKLPQRVDAASPDREREIGEREEREIGDGEVQLQRG